MINIITYISIGLISIIILISIFRKKKELKETPIDNFLEKYHIIILILIMILAVFLRIYDVSNLPRGLHCDEAGAAYDAYCLSEYGVDRYLNHNPVYLINFGGGQSVLYALIGSIFIKLFGLSVFTVRLPAIILSIISILIFYLLVKENINKKSALLVAFLVTICPWHIMMSRWGLDCNLLFSLLLISIYFLVRAKKCIHYIIAGVFIGISLYTYALSYIIIPVFLLLTLGYMLIIKKINFKQIIALGIPIFIIALPLINLVLLNNNWIEKNIFSFLSIPKLPSYRVNELGLTNFFKSFKSFFICMFFGDNMIYNTSNIIGSVYYISIPFVMIGFFESIINTIQSIKNKKFSLDTIILFVFLSVVSCMCIIKEPNINKGNAVFIALIYFMTIGILEISKKSKIILISILAIYAINFVYFSNYYFVEFKNNDDKIYEKFFNDTLMDVTIYLNDEKFNNKDVYFYTLDNPQPYIYILLANKMSPYVFNETKVKDQYFIEHFARYHFFVLNNDENNIYVFHESNINIIQEFKELNFICEDYKDYKIMYKE